MRRRSKFRGGTPGATGLAWSWREKNISLQKQAVLRQNLQVSIWAVRVGQVG